MTIFHVHEPFFSPYETWKLVSRDCFSRLYVTGIGPMKINQSLSENILAIFFFYRLAWFFFFSRKENEVNFYSTSATSFKCSLPVIFYSDFSRIYRQRKAGTFLKWCSSTGLQAWRLARTTCWWRENLS